MTFQEMLQNAIDKQKSIVNTAETEKRAMTAEETADFENAQTQIEELSKQIDMKNAIMADLQKSPTVAPLMDSGKPAELTVDSVEYKNAWLKNAQNPQQYANDPTVQNIIRQVNPVNAVHADTGVFVPTTIANTILSFMIEQHPILGDVQNLAVKGNFTINIHTGITANDAGPVAIGNCLEDETNAFASVTLGGFQYGKLVSIPWAMRAMSITAYESYLVREVSSRLGTVLANHIIYGRGPASIELSGIKPFLTSKAAARIVSAGAQVTYEHLTAAMGMTSKPTGTRFIYVNEQTFWAKMMNILDLEGRPLFFADPATGIMRSAFGVQIKFETAVADGEILIGKPQTGYLLNYNQSITAVTDDEPKCLKTNHIAWCVADGAPTTEKAWTILTTTGVIPQSEFEPMGFAATSGKAK